MQLTLHVTRRGSYLVRALSLRLVGENPARGVPTLDVRVHGNTFITMHLDSNEHLPNPHIHTAQEHTEGNTGQYA